MPVSPISAAFKDCPLHKSGPVFTVSGTSHSYFRRPQRHSPGPVTAPQSGTCHSATVRDLSQRHSPGPVTVQPAAKLRPPPTLCQTPFSRPSRTVSSSTARPPKARQGTANPGRTPQQTQHAHTHARHTHNANIRSSAGASVTCPVTDHQRQQRRPRHGRTRHADKVR